MGGYNVWRGTGRPLRKDQAITVIEGKERNDMPGYETQQMGDATEIWTTPEKVPARWLLVAIPRGLLVLIALSTGLIYGVLAAGFIYGAMYLLMQSKQATLYRAREISRLEEWHRSRCRHHSEGHHPSRHGAQSRAAGCR
jgi:hypothetical protein